MSSSDDFLSDEDFLISPVALKKTANGARSIEEE